MILLRLLTTGKSLVGLHESRNRYRVMHRGLPTFVAKQNPFRDHSAASEPARGAAVAESVREEKRPWYRRLIAGLGVQRETAVSGQQSPRPVAPTGTPAQCELSLDQVKVVRNDLSDSDIEVVARRRKQEELKSAPSANGSESAWERVSFRIFGAGKVS